MLFDAVGKEPNFFFAPLWLFDVIIDSLQFLADTFKSEKLENAAETGRIGNRVQNQLSIWKAPKLAPWQSQLDGSLVV